MSFNGLQGSFVRDISPDAGIDFSVDIVESSGQKSRSVNSYAWSADEEPTSSFGIVESGGRETLHYIADSSFLQSADEEPEHFNISGNRASIYRLLENESGTSDELCSKLENFQISEEQISGPILDPARQAAVERVMDHFWTIFDQRWGSNVQQNATGSSTRHERARGLNADSQPAQSTTSHRKRLRDEDNEDQEDNENEDRRLKRLNPRPRDKLADALKFACLFRKHNPSKYSIFDHRSCALSSWRTIGRLKEHLFRTHRIAIHCGRCWVTFKTADQLNAHITVDAAIICQTKPGLPPEGISPDMERKLRSRKKSHPNQSDEDRWRDMYKLLFPDEEIPFPYFEELRDEAPLSPDSRDFTEYEAYARRELPRLVRSSVLEVFRRELQPVEASLVANLVNTIQDCQDRLFRSYVGRANLEDNTASARPREDLCTYPRNTNDGTDEAFENRGYMPSDFLSAAYEPPPLQDSDLVDGLLNLEPQTEHSKSFEQGPNSLSSFADGLFSELHRGSRDLCNCPDFCNCAEATTNTSYQPPSDSVMPDEFGDKEGGSFDWIL